MVLLLLRPLPVSALQNECRLADRVLKLQPLSPEEARNEWRRRHPRV